MLKYSFQLKLLISNIISNLPPNVVVPQVHEHLVPRPPPAPGASPSPPPPLHPYSPPPRPLRRVDEHARDGAAVPHVSITFPPLHLVAMVVVATVTLGPRSIAPAAPQLLLETVPVGNNKTIYFNNYKTY